MSLRLRQHLTLVNSDVQSQCPDTQTSYGIGLNYYRQYRPSLGLAGLGWSSQVLT